MVIIEVNRSFQQLDRLLGQHKWEEFLQNPTEEEKERYSSIFFCTKNTVREVSKAGEPIPHGQAFAFDIYPVQLFRVEESRCGGILV